MVRRPLLLLFAVACSSPPARPPATRPTPSPPAPATFTCTTPSRLCDLVALAEMANLDELAAQLYGDDGRTEAPPQ